MASRYKSNISPWNKNRRWEAEPKSKPPVYNKSFERTAISKLKKLPDPSYREYGENQVALEAKDLIDPTSIMDRYFSEIVHNLLEERVDEKLQEEANSEFVTSVEKEAGRERSKWRVEDAAKLEVKLLLRQCNGASMGRLARTAASLLHMEYGPLHTSLLINNSILLEWNTCSLVIPERYDGANQHYPLMTTAFQRTDHVSLIRYNPEDEVDLMFQATKSKLDILKALIDVISQYNGLYYYHTISRNCQRFVIDALKAMGCKNPPKFEGNLQAYFERLKAGSCQPEFTNHEELDHYVIANVLNSQNERPLSSQEKEYLLGQYFMFHVPNMTEDEQPERWRCPERDCQMNKLEEHLEEEKMIMHQFLHVGQEGTQT